MVNAGLMTSDRNSRQFKISNTGTYNSAKVGTTALRNISDISIDREAEYTDDILSLRFKTQLT